MTDDISRLTPPLINRGPEVSRRWPGGVTPTPDSCNQAQGAGPGGVRVGEHGSDEIIC